MISNNYIIRTNVYYLFLYCCSRCVKSCNRIPIINRRRGTTRRRSNRSTPRTASPAGRGTYRARPCRSRRCSPSRRNPPRGAARTHQPPRTTPGTPTCRRGPAPRARRRSLEGGPLHPPHTGTLDVHHARGEGGGRRGSGCRSRSASLHGAPAPRWCQPGPRAGRLQPRVDDPATPEDAVVLGDDLRRGQLGGDDFERCEDATAAEKV